MSAIRIPSGSTTVKIPFIAANASKVRQAGLTGFTVYYSRNGGTLTLVSAITVTESGSANAPGLYWLLCNEGTTLDPGFFEQSLVYHISHGSMEDVDREVTIGRFVVDSGACTVTTTGVNNFSTNMTPAEADMYADMFVQFRDDTTTAGLRGVVRKISAITVGGVITLTKDLPISTADTDSFDIF